MYFEYSHFDIWHKDYPEQKLTAKEAMCKRGACIKGFRILTSQGLIPFTADKHRMEAQEITGE